MIQLQPREIFTIVRQLPDPGDTGTYYVRADIYNSRTGVLLTSINLVDRGNQRFSQDYQVPADVSGQGFYIDITTNVFTDNLYTVNSTVYGRDNNSYLVFDRISRLSGGGSGGSDVDYKKIQKLLKDILTPVMDVDGKGNFTSIRMEKVSMEPFMGQLRDVYAVVKAIEIPEHEEVDFTEITTAISSTEKRLLSHIDKKEVTESTDLTPVLDAISGLKESVEKTCEESNAEMKEYVTKMEDMCNEYQKIFKDDYPQLAANLDIMVKQLKEAVAYSTILPKGDKPKTLQDRVRDIKL